jgi:protein-disulfide isomerase
LPIRDRDPFPFESDETPGIERWKEIGVSPLLKLQREMKRYLPFTIIGAVLFIAIGGGVFIFRAKQRVVAGNLAAAAKKAVSSSTPGAEPPHVRGRADALVTLEEFGDFQCGSCGDLSDVLVKIEQDYGARLRVIFRQFPLAMHLHALEAARASEAAGLQGRFWEMHDLLYHERFIWPRAPDIRVAFNDYAKTLGLDLERFKKDMDSEEVKARIVADQRRALSLGVDRTPILFINNRQVPATSLTPPGLHAAIDAALNPQIQ